MSAISIVLDFGEPLTASVDDYGFLILQAGTERIHFLLPKGRAQALCDAINAASDNPTTQARELANELA